MSSIKGPGPHRHCRDKLTFRQAGRKWMHTKYIMQRIVYVPERNIDRFYKKHNYEVQPAVWCNAILSECEAENGGSEITHLHIGRWW